MRRLLGVRSSKIPISKALPSNLLHCAWTRPRQRMTPMPRACSAAAPREESAEAQADSSIVLLKVSESGAVMHCIVGGIACRSGWPYNAMLQGDRGTSLMCSSPLLTMPPKERRACFCENGRTDSFQSPCVNKALQQHNTT